MRSRGRAVFACRYQGGRAELRIPVGPIALTFVASPPKAHLPGKGASCPQHGEGGRPFEPGRVRGTHSSAGGVGVPTFSRHPLMPRSEATPMSIR